MKRKFYYQYQSACSYLKQKKKPWKLYEEKFKLSVEKLWTLVETYLLCFPFAFTKTHI